jgi:sugar phosphate isomerase/epimerase
MLKIGLTSITLRQYSADEIIALSAHIGINGIEWGSDLHVPQGDVKLAECIKSKTEAAGLTVCAYGSYYKCDDASAPFADYLNSAKALGAPLIRVWAGTKGSDKSSQNDRDKVVQRLRQTVTAAKEHGIKIALEYHGGTLTDTQESAHRLLKEVNLPELKLFWQPRAFGTHETDLVELQASLPYLANVHCFNWMPDVPGESVIRRPLSEGSAKWKEYLKHIRQVEGDRYITIEFVKDDSLEQLKDDVETLQKLIGA